MLFLKQSTRNLKVKCISHVAQIAKFGAFWQIMDTLTL